MTTNGIFVPVGRQMEFWFYGSDVSDFVRFEHNLRVFIPYTYPHLYKSCKIILLADRIRFCIAEMDSEGAVRYTYNFWDQMFHLYMSNGLVFSKTQEQY